MQVPRLNASDHCVRTSLEMHRSSLRPTAPAPQSLYERKEQVIYFKLILTIPRVQVYIKMSNIFYCLHEESHRYPFNSSHISTTEN